MKKYIFLSLFFGTMSFASAQNTIVKWVGQFPQEQVVPVVDLFNKEFALQYGFSIEYKTDEAVVSDLLAGKSHPEFDLVHMKDADMLNSLAKKSLSSNLRLQNGPILPEYLKDPNGHWIPLLKRARIIYYNSDLVSVGEVKTYEDLGDAKFKDKLCLRQKKAQYNIGLYSFFLGVWGTQKTAAVLKTWSDNSAALPALEKDLDDVIAKINTGECAVGVANTYYYMRHLRAEPNSRVKPVIPNQGDIATHINIDGVGVLKAGAHSTEAEAFANWLLTEKPQLMLSTLTDKFPVNPAVQAPALEKVFGQFKDSQTFSLNSITDLKAEALAIATEQGLK